MKDARFLRLLLDRYGGGLRPSVQGIQAAAFMEGPQAEAGTHRQQRSFQERLSSGATAEHRAAQPAVRMGKPLAAGAAQRKRGRNLVLVRVVNYVFGGFADGTLRNS